jgi:hypothetical protein
MKNWWALWFTLFVVLLPHTAYAGNQIATTFEHDWFVALDVELNGEPVKLVVDTGSPRTVIFNPSKFSITPVNDADTQTGVFIDSSRVELTEAWGNFSINGGVAIDREILIPTNDDQLSTSLKRSARLVDGVLGLDFLDAADTQIDFNSVTLAGSEQPSGLAPIIFDFQIQTQNFRCWLDTGLKRGEHIVLRPRSEATRNKISKMANVSILRPSRSQSGETALFFKAPVSYDGVTEIVSILLENAAVSRSLPKGIEECALGPQWLLSHVVHVTESGPALLHKRPIEFYYNFTGISSISPTLEGDALEIMMVEPGSPSAESRLRRGDLILSVDERSVSSLSLDEIQSFMRTPPGETLSLVVNRNGKILTVELATKDYL